MRTAVGLAAVVGLAPGCGAAKGEPESVREVMTQAVAPLDGSHVTLSVVEVRYGPGAGSEPHRHTCPVVGYVVEGTLRTQVRGGPVQVVRAGESFYEPANGVHQVSANASERDPVRFTATFLCDHPPPHTLGPPADSAASP